MLVPFIYVQLKTMSTAFDANSISNLLISASFGAVPRLAVLLRVSPHHFGVGTSIRALKRAPVSTSVSLLLISLQVTGSANSSV